MLVRMFNWIKRRFTNKANRKEKRGFDKDNPFLIL